MSLERRHPAALLPSVVAGRPPASLPSLRVERLPYPLRTLLRRWRGMLGMVLGVGIALGIGMAMLGVNRAILDLVTRDFRASGADLRVIAQGGTLIPVLPGDSPGTIKHAGSVLTQIRGLPGRDGGHRGDELGAGARAPRPAPRGRAGRAGRRHGDRRGPDPDPGRGDTRRGTLDPARGRARGWAEAEPREADRRRRHASAGRAGLPGRRRRQAPRVQLRGGRRRLSRTAVAPPASDDRRPREPDCRGHRPPGPRAGTHPGPGLARRLRRRTRPCAWPKTPRPPIASSPGS